VVLQAAREEFAVSGYAGARVQRIASRSGLNKQLIYYYFGSKAALYEAAVERPRLDSPSGRGSATTTPEALRSTLADVLSELVDRPELCALLVHPRPSHSTDDLAHAWMRRAVESVSARISTGQGLGYFRDDADPVTVARQAVVLCVGYMALRPTLPVDGDAWLRSLGDTLLRALGW
jgi:TetR/AcrR family transcriptional regulator